MPDKKPLNRRDFLKKWGMRLLYVAGSAALAFPILSFINFRKNTKKEIVFHPKEQESIVNFKEGAFLIKEGDTTYALSARCTHLGCTLGYDPVSRTLPCPCHKSVFALSGKRISGPASKNLEKAQLAVKANGDIVVTLGLQ